AQPALKTRLVFRLALPNGQYTPTGPPQLLQHTPVALAISVDFFSPKFDVRGWSACAWTIVAVPKTAIDEYDTPTFSEYDIGTARQVRCIKPVAVSQAEQKTPYDMLRTGILTAYGGHVCASLTRRQA